MKKIGLLFAGSLLALLPLYGAYAQSQIPPLNISQLSYASVPDFANDPSQWVTLNDGSVHGVNTYGANWVVALNSFYQAPVSYTIGDFDNDGAQDIAVTIVASGGGSGSFYYLVLFRNNNGTPQYYAAQPLGDRITVNKVSYANEMFSADIITQGPGEPMCCGTFNTVLHFSLVNGSLVSTDEPATASEDSSSTAQQERFQQIQQDLDAYRAQRDATNAPSADNSDSPSGYEWADKIFGFIAITLIIGAVSRARTKPATSSQSQKQSAPDEENFESASAHTHTKTRRPKDDPELKALYRKVVRKYHPDHAHGEEDKKFRNDLTAKLNRAYQDGDIDTLRMFE